LFCGLTCGAAVACGSLLAHFANRYGAPLWLSAGVGWCLAERLLQSIADSAGTSADPLRLAIVGSLPLNWLSAAVVRWGGCATASWAVAGCGGLALDIWKRPTATAGIPGVVVMALVSGLTDWGQAEPHDVPTTRIAVMPVVSLEILRNATAALKTSQAELLVLPELSIPDWDRGHPLWTEIQRVSAETGVPICFATLRYDRGQSELRNSVALVDPRSGIHFVYDKRWPSPIGERQTSWGGMTLLPGSGGAEINVSAGAAPRESYRLPDGARVGFGVCHDACFDGWVREYRRLSTPPVLLVLCSSEKFDRQGSSRRVFEMILRMRAIQAEMSIVRCSGGGSSGCVLSSGRWSQPAARSAHFTVFKTHLNR
ncbi:MAG: hypothetical protein NT069_23775, partial [Planctomycetota bacterium]|nr:hypothetical protein [Planctomycetota bacterium]